MNEIKNIEVGDVIYYRNKYYKVSEVDTCDYLQTFEDNTINIYAVESSRINKEDE